MGTMDMDSSLLPMDIGHARHDPHALEAMPSRPEGRTGSTWRTVSSGTYICDDAAETLLASKAQPMRTSSTSFF